MKSSGASSRRYFSEIDECCVTDGSNTEMSDEVCVNLLKEQAYQKKRNDFLKEKRNILLMNNDSLNRECVSCLDELQSSVTVNDRLRALAEEWKGREAAEREANAAAIKEQENRPTIQALFADEVKDLQKRLDAHTARGQSLVDENNALRSEFKDLLAAHDKRDEEIFAELKEIEERFTAAIMRKQQNLLATKANAELSEQLHADIKKHEEKNLSMKQQVELYAAKFDHFQSEWDKNDATFQAYKARMEQMQAGINKLESEKNHLKGKYTHKLIALKQLQQSCGGAGSGASQGEGAATSGAEALAALMAKTAKQVASLARLNETFAEQKRMLLAAVEEQRKGEAEGEGGEESGSGAGDDEVEEGKAAFLTGSESAERERAAAAPATASTAERGEETVVEVEGPR